MAGIIFGKYYCSCSVAQLCLTLCDLMDCSTPGLPAHPQLPEFTQTHLHRIGDATQPSHPLSFPSPPTFNLSQHQGLFQWVSSSHQVARVLEPQLQHHSFQWRFRIQLLFIIKYDNAIFIILSNHKTILLSIFIICALVLQGLFTTSFKFVSLSLLLFLPPWQCSR